MTKEDCYHHIDFQKAPHIPEHIKRYLRGEIPQSCFHRRSSPEGFMDQAKEKQQNFAHQTRVLLVSVLERQYQRCNQNIAPLDAVRDNLEALKLRNTMTVTTGHQLCLGGGPLYSFYKIYDAIVTAKKMTAMGSGFRFVPVFWMASEDHDWAEVNHLYFRDKKIVWDKKVEGTVGRVSTEGADVIWEKISNLLGNGKVKSDIQSRWENAYLRHGNFADATRQWAHDLFGAEGLVILDADDCELKKEMIPLVKEELFANGFKSEVEKTNAILQSAGLPTQAYAAPINIFYIGAGKREYVEKSGDNWVLGDQNFNREELLDELENFPERFSPNVILRPVFQEMILPNVAYIGGPGELAYWFQLKGIFDRRNLPFPILQLRKGFALLTAKDWRQYEKIDCDLLEKDPKLWKRAWVEKHSKMPLHLVEEKNILKRMFDHLEVVAEKTDYSMIGAVKAQRAKQSKGLLNLEKKLMRAEKRKHTEAIAHIDSFMSVMYPEGIPQERHDSLWQWWEAFGQNPLQKLKEDGEFVVIVDNSK
ncbi:MAG: bacillithiol biosynthesis cysteine-adding enzyme BshC [Cryomorphaceae bacterium]|nr:bacillithiol biosynthesis cysteine-adding enzyme BshC [Cryomorphaceae bacterium]